MVRKLAPELLDRLIEMARLSLSGREKKALFQELNKILDAFGNVKRASGGKHPSSGARVKLSFLKSKRAVSCVLAEELLKRAPERRERFFRVPKVSRLE